MMLDRSGDRGVYDSTMIARHLCQTAAVIALTTSGTFAAEGKSPAWTDVAEADVKLMGDYEGEWVGAPENHYFDFNKPVAAQVRNVQDGEYFLRFFQEHDCRADAYFEGPGKLEGGVIKFSGNGWTGEVGPDGLTGYGRGYGKQVKFALKRVERASPTLGAKPPEGAMVLFDGKDFSKWQHGDGRAVTWHLLDGGAMEVRSAVSDEDRKNKIGGDIQTVESFGDCKVHLEFRYPVEPGKAGQGRGNSGFFFQGAHEVQVLNSYGLQGLWNECGALYKLAPPKVNAARPPMQWQTYDVEYRATRRDGGQTGAGADHGAAQWRVDPHGRGNQAWDLARAARTGPTCRRSRGRSVCRTMAMPSSTGISGSCRCEVGGGGSGGGRG